MAVSRVTMSSSAGANLIESSICKAVCGGYRLIAAQILASCTAYALSSACICLPSVDACCREAGHTCRPALVIGLRSLVRVTELWMHTALHGPD